MIPCLFNPINSSKSPSVLQRSLLLASNFDFLHFSPMASFALLKFWKTSNAKVAGYGDPVTETAADDAKCLVSVVEEEEDSFFELEFTLSDNAPQSEYKEKKTDIKIGRIGDFISDEEPDARINSKPQSPMSILRESAPKLRVFMLGKLIKRSKPEKASEAQCISTADASMSSKSKNKINFTVKLRIEDAGALKKKFSRSDSCKSTERRNSNGGEDKEIEVSSRRFSKDSVNKYLNLIKKPLYVKLSSTSSNSKRSSDLRAPFDCAATSSFMSPRKSEDRTNSNSRFRAPCKKLKKSRSAGALPVGVSSPPAPAIWKDDSLVQQNDGIQGAILHCKQSFNACPQEWRVMSRCASDTSHEKSIQRSDE
ncbi:hypothetical protein V2J09_011207 [Rumex salicifolius]